MFMRRIFVGIWEEITLSLKIVLLHREQQLQQKLQQPEGAEEGAEAEEISSQPWIFANNMTIDHRILPSQFKYHIYSFTYITYFKE